MAALWRLLTTGLEEIPRYNVDYSWNKRSSLETMGMMIDEFEF